MLRQQGESPIERLIELQDELNARWLEASPAERAESAVAALRAMPGQAYLFAEADEADA